MMQFKTIRRTATAALLALSVLLSGCAQTSSSGSSSPSVASGPKKTVTLALASQTDQLTGIWGVAQSRGYIDQELSPLNYQLKVTGFAQAGPAVNEAFVSGSIDLADYGNLPPVVLKSKGFSVSVVAFSDAQLNFSLVVPASSKINTPKDLEGKKVIVARGTIADQYWADLVKEYKIDESKVQIINDAANAVTTFTNGSADAWVTNDVYAQIVNLKFPVKAVESTVSTHPEWASQEVVAVRDQFGKEHGDVVTALLKAYVRAYNYASQHQDEAIQAFATKDFPLPAVKAAYAGTGETWTHLSGDPNADNKKRLQTLSNFLLQNQLISKKVDVGTLVNDSFYKKAKAAVGSTYDTVK